jgi:hypothetical protein
MTRDIREIIERVVREQFAGIAILSVKVTDDTDYDGDPVFRVTVVVDDAATPLDSGKTSGIVRHIREKLLAQHEEAFPILAFVTQSDAARIGTATP